LYGECKSGGGGGINPIGLLIGVSISVTMGIKLGDLITTINNKQPPSPFLSFYISFNARQSTV